MSRFYQALKGAHFGLPESGGEVVQPVVAPLGSDAEAEGGTPSAARIELPDIDEVYGRDPVTDTVSDGSYGKHADVILDQTARLIPHAVDPSVLEHYRRLRTKIMQQHHVKPFRSLLITSPNPGEGKSVTTLNLAFSFALLPSFRIVVVDGDLRKGSLGHWLGVANLPGLSNLIDGSAELEDVVLKSNESPMCFVVSGTSKTSPGELLNSGSLAGHFRRLGEHFDLILIDSPPLNLITDAQLLAANCDAVLLVARAFSTTCKAFQKTVQDLAPFRVIGTILNGGIEASPYGYGYRGY